MAAKNAPFGTDSTPEVVVKIIGSKHVKYFVDMPKKAKPVNSNSQQLVSEFLQYSESEVTKVPPDKPVPAVHLLTEHLEAQELIPQQTKKKQKAGMQRSTGQTAEEGHSHELQSAMGMLRDPGPLSTIVRKELQSWTSVGLESVEEELKQLDPTYSGIVHQSQLLLAFLRQEAPLLLSTMRLLLKTFADPTNPEQVHYRQLLDLIAGAVKTEGQKVNIETHCSRTSDDQVLSAAVTPTEITDIARTIIKNGEGTQSVYQQVTKDYQTNDEQVYAKSKNVRPQIQRFSKSTGSERQGEMQLPTYGETWLQRFQRMEKGLHMCDYKNTGYLEKDEAKRLIHNYNLIFNLNLSPLKISEGLHTFQSEGVVNLDSLLHYLKEL
ncbi:uncharacterized protein C1orf87 isoform X2 [Lepisosteus oculatus]|nr:PREDICTED: uncharacterized protein C1orf87 homolog [Lepisosteus oculatus]